MSQNIQFIATVAVIIIFLSLFWIYQTSFKKNQKQNKHNSAVLGILIIVLSLLAAMWMIN